MKRNKLLLLLGILVVVGFASPSMAATTLKKMGTHPFYTPPLTSVADLQAMVKKRDARIKEGFAKAGAADLYPAFAEQFPNAKIETVQIQPGQTIQWMLFRKWGKGKVAAARDIVWGGKHPFEAYAFTIEKDGTQYQFIVPRVCGNIALMSISCPAPVAAAPPPAPEPQPAPVAAPPPVEQVMSGPFATVGYMYQFDPGHYIFGKIGYDFAVTRDFHLLPSVGVFGKVSGNDGATSFTVDLLASYYVASDFALGIGVGYWSGELQTRDDWGRRVTGDDNNIDLIVAAYYDLPTTWGPLKPSLYIEGRNDMSNFDDIGKTGRLGGGLMVHF